MMSDDDRDNAPDGAASNVPDLDVNQARLAYSIIETLLEHTRATNDLVALMAQALDEDTKNALTDTLPWRDYLESRRRLHAAEADMERFTEIMRALGEE